MFNSSEFNSVALNSHALGSGIVTGNVTITCDSTVEGEANTQRGSGTITTISSVEAYGNIIANGDVNVNCETEVEAESYGNVDAIAEVEITCEATVEGEGSVFRYVIGECEDITSEATVEGSGNIIASGSGVIDAFATVVREPEGIGEIDCETTVTGNGTIDNLYRLNGTKRIIYKFPDDELVKTNKEPIDNFFKLMKFYHNMKDVNQTLQSVRVLARKELDSYHMDSVSYEDENDESFVGRWYGADTSGNMLIWNPNNEELLTKSNLIEGERRFVHQNATGVMKKYRGQFAIYMGENL